MNWDSNTLDVDDSGFVVGSAFASIPNTEYDVSVGVISYTYDDGEKVNHVPNITISKETGEVIAEPSARDSPVPETAIDNALRAGRYAFENIEEYL